MEAAIVLVTTSSGEEAARLARVLVEERLAACANVIPRVQSVYRWQGQIETADEWLLVIKTTRRMLDRLTARVQALHSYTVPEIIALPLIGGSDSYLRWLREQVES